MCSSKVLFNQMMVCTMPGRLIRLKVIARLKSGDLAKRHKILLFPAQGSMQTMINSLRKIFSSIIILTTCLSTIYYYFVVVFLFWINSAGINSADSEFNSQIGIQEFPRFMDSVINFWINLGSFEVLPPV